MKKTLCALGICALAATTGFAQVKKLQPVQKGETTQKAEVKNAEVKRAIAKPEVQATTPVVNTTVQFKTETHDFGTLMEGDAAEAEFVFTNTGKEPLIIQTVKPQCGCTTPFYSKEPVAPGKTGSIKAAYGTKGRVGPFNKSITVTSTAGSKVLWIKGVVEKAPEGSAPQNTSMIKTH